MAMIPSDFSDDRWLGSCLDVLNLNSSRNLSEPSYFVLTNIWKHIVCMATVF